MRLFSEIRSSNCGENDPVYSSHEASVSWLCHFVYDWSHVYSVPPEKNARLSLQLFRFDVIVVWNVKCRIVYIAGICLKMEDSPVLTKNMENAWLTLELK